MNIAEIKEKVSIADFLEKLGIEPKHRSGAEAFYLSPIRASDTDASFSVNEKKGKWFDHGEGKGGNLIDLALLYYNTASVKTVVQRINDLFSGVLILPIANRNENFKTNDIEVKNYNIIKTKDLGSNPSITNYLSTRGLDTGDKHNLREVYYELKNQAGESKNYFGVGWQNESGGWDIRNPYFKGCLGKKDITFIKGFGFQIQVFEAMLDYQSAIKENPHRTLATSIIMNSTAMVEKTIQKIKEEKFSEIELFLDNDATGKKITEKLLENFPTAKDCSNLYAGFKDYNEKLMANNLRPWQSLDVKEENNNITR
ncbi:hypothetical protein FA048_12660 [Pedobacter polaris]|uniref:Zinc finger CHC2-type domain-containing protein n=2 Tax=Pedobacter polaris TaxID=2571273 RepID=A0A4U1CLT6_9SPHI|nr:toprim domain-containing protein [Pedobacter polaris]TKC08009.1 hypothetical protein FA048_12660 [Pedobacter polaris]